MLVEHVFVTTYEMDHAMGLACGFLQGAGFRLASVTPDTIEAVRGRKQATARKVVQLPQVVRLTYDRGRVTVAANITPRGGKEMPVHAKLMTAMARGLEWLLVDGRSTDEMMAEWAGADSAAGSIWTIGDKIAVVCLVILLVFIAVGIAIGIIIAMTESFV